MSETVKVAVRIRPATSGEINKKEKIVARKRNSSVVISSPDSNEERTFPFHYVFGKDTSQEAVFQSTAVPILDSVMSGYNGCIFCYGQTGTGKTYTMEGIPSDPKNRGIVPSTFQHLFNSIQDQGDNVKFLVRVSFVEIYNDEVYDLLANRKKLMLKGNAKGGFYLKDATPMDAHSVEDCMKMLEIGHNTRSVGATKMNPGSSRSHSILTLILESETTEIDEISKEEVSNYKVGKLNLVDLAGSERQKKTEATGDRLKEAKNINLSLMALGNVIKSLVAKGNQHVPFRNSKLTRLLKDSLGGNSKTVMIANIGPCATNRDETIATLRYASRAKLIKNKPIVNEDPKDTLLKKLRDELNRLREQVASNSTINPSQEPHDDTEDLTKRMKGQEDLLGLEREKAKQKHEKYSKKLEKFDTKIEATTNQLKALEEQITSIESKLVSGGTKLEEQTKATVEMLEVTEENAKQAEQNSIKLVQNLRELKHRNKQMKIEVQNSEQESKLLRTKIEDAFFLLAGMNMVAK